MVVEMIEMCLDALEFQEKQMASLKAFSSVGGNVVRWELHYNATEFVSCSAVFGRQFYNLYWVGTEEERG